MNLGAIIKELRQRKGIKQNSFAELCNISSTYLSKIENNSKEPNLSTLRIIANNLDVPLPILIFLSINEDDIKPDKKEAFELLGPSIKALLNEFFNTPSK